MTAHSIRRKPWTCLFGRFGVTVEQLGPEQSRVDDVFWACCHQAFAPTPRLTTRGECEQCPLWQASPRFDRDC